MQKIDVSTQAKRVQHCMDAALAGAGSWCSGGAAKADAVYDDARAIRDAAAMVRSSGATASSAARGRAGYGQAVDIYKGRD